MKGSIILKPIVTERLTKLGESKQKQYGFRVSVDANKPELKKLIENMYGVNVESIRTLVVAGKKRFRYSKAGVIQGKSQNYKKVFVTLREGQEINFYENV